MVWIPLHNSTTATFPLGLPEQEVTGLVDLVGFQQAPNLRGTMSIIFSCATIIVIAVYTSYHPTGATFFSPSYSQMEKELPKGFKLKDLMARVVLTTLFPETIVDQALDEYIIARRRTRHFRRELKLSRWTQVHSHVLGMYGFFLPRDGVNRVANGAEITRHIRSGALRDSDLPTAAELMDLGKADSLAKILTIFQVLWIVVQCLARWLSHLTVTRLELMTSGYAICAVLVSILWISKPYRAENHPVHLSCTGPHSPHNNSSVTYSETGGIFYQRQIGSTLAGLILSALHFAAWNGIFPTHLEQRMWRVISIVHVAMVGLNAMAWVFKLGCLSFIQSYGFYFPSLSRLLLVGLSIASLRALPAGAYIQPAWTNFFPHFT
ncbi:hypothetical protein DL96DRAFT_588885 [Flagelloscypha sp. PMI_526]|nr:hypothetical protein DL96DRAFT_588885 [Flagelloscypha sp. PMI_526]